MTAYREGQFSNLAQRHQNSLAYIEAELAEGAAGQDRARDYIRRSSGVVALDDGEAEAFEQHLSARGFEVPLVWELLPIRVQAKHWSRDQLWFRNLCAVMAFACRCDRLPSREASDGAERSLGEWITHQRRRARGTSPQHAALTHNQLDLLAAIPGLMTDRNASWDANFKAVRAFTNERGRVPSQGSEDDHERRLGRWVVRQRQRLRGTDRNRAPLSSRERAALETLPGFAEGSGDAWATMFSRVKAFVAEHGALPRRNGTGSQRELAHWLSKQRAYHRSTTPNMRAKRRHRSALLETIPGFATA